VPARKTAKAKPRRNGKTKKKTAKAAVLAKQKAKLETPIGLPLNVVVRNGTESRPGESYILHTHNGKKVYLAGTTARRCPTYRSVVADLAQRCTDGDFRTVADAKQWLDSKM
jgi:hypothetical protein